ncbi:MAG: hypothetical protein J0L75_20370 [Spirochaetes bacterium]|nr:hypothetical protein [Spirochaetota bacterium]
MGIFRRLFGSSTAEKNAGALEIPLASKLREEIVGAYAARVAHEEAEFTRELLEDIARSRKHFRFEAHVNVKSKAVEDAQMHALANVAARFKAKGYRALLGAQGSLTVSWKESPAKTKKR